MIAFVCSNSTSYFSGCRFVGKIQNQGNSVFSKLGESGCVMTRSCAMVSIATPKLIASRFGKQVCFQFCVVLVGRRCSLAQGLVEPCEHEHVDILGSLLYASVSCLKYDWQSGWFCCVIPIVKMPFSCENGCRQLRMSLQVETNTYTNCAMWSDIISR